MDCSPIFSCTADGIAPTRHLAADRWLPRWEPWPGEALTLRFARPAPAEGATTTLDSAILKLTSGRRLLEAELVLSMRSSQGGEQSVTLPPEATLRSFSVDGSNHPAQPDGERLVYAIEPGDHTILASWSQPAAEGLFPRAPRVDVGQRAANAQVQWELPRHRWVLWAWGPAWGPVVTVWQYLLVLLLAGVLLGRLAPTPLSAVDWFLLGLGLTQVPPALSSVLVLWLLALSFRGRGAPRTWYSHDMAQLVLLGLTAAALSILYAGVYQGLVVEPDLGVQGGSSYGRSLRWFTDAAGPEMPRPGVFWLPLWVWRIAMLGWALWLASRLIRWLKWGWEQASVGGLWQRPPAFLSRRPAQPSASPASPDVETVRIDPA